MIGDVLEVIESYFMKHHSNYKNNIISMVNILLDNISAGRFFNQWVLTVIRCFRNCLCAYIRQN